MADQLDKIVQVTIERRTRVASMKSFSEHLVAAEFSPVGITPIFDPDNRVRQFGSLDEITEAGFPVDGFVYRAAAKQYSQPNHIKDIYVGWKIPEGVNLTTGILSNALVAGQSIDWTVNGVAMETISFDMEGNSEKCIERMVEILKEEYGTSFTAKKVDARTLTLYGATATITVTVNGGAEQPTMSFTSKTIPADANWTVALNKIKEQNNDWYAISVSARQMLNQQECAQWIQANRKLGGLCNGDSAMVDQATGNIGAWAKLNNLDHVFILYHPDAELASTIDTTSSTDPIPEAALFGLMLTKKPGAATWKFKELASIPTYDLKQGQVTNLEKNNVNWYMTTAGVPMTSNGQVASGEFIDVIHGVDWLEARIQNLVFTALIGVDKVPFTDEGVQMVVSPLKVALEEAKKNGILASYEIEYPAVAEVSVTDKGKRFLPDVKFTGVLAGAIHATKINGVVTL